MKVLISAYACEPGKGSEPGVGWNWALAAARRHETWVLTRANNQPAIEQALAESPQPTMRFVYLDLPSWVLRWKRGGVTVRLYYIVWQLLAAREARRFQRDESFDLVHHLTFANVFLPALACLAGPPFILGPVGGGQRVPLRLYPALGLRGATQELLLLGVRQIMRLNPLVRTSWKRAAVILVNNEESRRALPARFRHKTVLRPNACVRPEVAALRRDDRDRVAVYAGRLNRFKGVELAIRAMTLAPSWTLSVIGDGSDARRLRALTRRLGLDGRVNFEGWLSQEALWARLATSGALLFPSLKEGAPSIIAEAQALGVPVVAFDLSGVAVLARQPGVQIELVAPTLPAEAVQAFAAALGRLERGPVNRPDPRLGLDDVAFDLDRAYRIACASEPVTNAAAAWTAGRASEPRSPQHSPT